MRRYGDAAIAAGLILTLFAGAAAFVGLAALLGLRDRLRWRRLAPDVRHALEVEDGMRR